MKNPTKPFDQPKILLKLGLQRGSLCLWCCDQTLGGQDGGRGFCRDPGGGDGGSAEGAEKWREFGCILKAEPAVVPGGVYVMCDRKRRPVGPSYKPRLPPPTGPHEQVTPAALYLRPSLEITWGTGVYYFRIRSFNCQTFH